MSLQRKTVDVNSGKDNMGMGKKEIVTSISQLEPERTQMD